MAGSVAVRDDTCSTVLTGSLSMLFDIPLQLLAKHQGRKFENIENILEAERAREDSVRDGLSQLTHSAAAGGAAEDVKVAAPALQPKVSLPSFGLGLKRQRSIGNHILTDEAKACDGDAISRCAAAVIRLERHHEPRKDSQSM